MIQPNSLSAAMIAAETSTPNASLKAPWIADLGDGRYQNPVLYADYSDPDVVRVGEDYWMTASSFNHVPGLPILHSRDLVNWTLVNHALPALVPAEYFSQPRHGQGVWAPSIRFHAGKFWIFYPDPDFGLYMITALEPSGQWSTPVLVKSGRGLIDPCPFWDDDGEVYLIHGWARSRSGIHNVLTLHRLSPDATRVVDEGKIVIDGNKLPGWNTIEGPKLYKRNHWYYIFAPAGGVGTGYQAIFRSKNIHGPYDSRVVLEQGSTQINGPHQGAWVETPSGEHWFFHFQEISAYGRVVHLQPMHWREDEWPVMGRDSDGDGKGEPVLTHGKPALPVRSKAVPATSDEFDKPTLGLQWQWQANPKPDWAALTGGSLQLRCLPLAATRTHWSTSHLLMQKFPAPSFRATTALRFSPKEMGDSAGLIVFGYDYAWVGLRQEKEGVHLVVCSCRGAQKKGEEKTALQLPVATTAIFLSVTVTPGAHYRFAYSFDGAAFSLIGDEYQATSSKWVGGKVGLFASTLPGVSSAGHADFDGFSLNS